MATRLGINGFGRIGRMVLRAALNNPEVEVIAINDLTDAPTMAAPAGIRLRSRKTRRKRLLEGRDPPGGRPLHRGHIGQGPRKAPVGRHGRGCRDGMHRAVRGPRKRFQAPVFGRAEDDHLRSRQEPRRHRRHGGSTTTSTNPAPITSCPTPLAPPTASRRSQRSCWKTSGSNTA